MLGRFLRVARPDDWTGTLSRVAVGTAFVLLAIVIALVRMPPTWLAFARGHGLAIRLALLVVALLVFAGARALLIARLPRAAFLFGRRVRFHDGTRRVALHIDEIASVHVEQRPPPVHEAFVLVQRDGGEHDLCPTHWWGAPRLYRSLTHRVGTASRRRARARAAEQRRARKRSAGAAARPPKG